MTAVAPMTDWEYDTHIPKDYCPVCGAHGLAACQDDHGQMSVDHPERPKTLGPF